MALKKNCKYCGIKVEKWQVPFGRRVFKGICKPCYYSMVNERVQNISKSENNGC